MDRNSPISETSKGSIFGKAAFQGVGRSVAARTQGGLAAERRAAAGADAGACPGITFDPAIEDTKTRMLWRKSLILNKAGVAEGGVEIGAVEQEQVLVPARARNRDRGTAAVTGESLRRRHLRGARQAIQLMK